MQELNQRSSLETHKLELMTEIGNLHLRQSRMERENLELREQLRAAEITSLKFSVLPQSSRATPLDLHNECLDTFSSFPTGGSMSQSFTAHSGSHPPVLQSSNVNGGQNRNFADSRMKSDQFYSLPRSGKDLVKSEFIIIIQLIAS
jgi:hypothetical protein